MTLHKAGIGFIFLILILLGIMHIGMWFLISSYPIIFWSYTVLAVAFFSLIVLFFRKPERIIHTYKKGVYAPADGTVVTIEEVEEHEYFKEKRIQISVFMSPLNVHINWFPVSGQVVFLKQHSGKHLFAWLPKSSTDNERTTMVIEMENGTKVLVRQIAGALARRIVTYTGEGHTAKQNTDFGFIKFGSRVDVFLPLDVKVNVTLDQKVRGGQTILAEF